MEIGLCCAGGNARGPVHVATAKRLAAENHIRWAVGGSVGVCTAYAAQAGLLETLEKIYRDFQGEHEYMRLNTRLGDRRSGVYTLVPLRDRLRPLVSRSRLAKDRLFYVAVVELERGRLHAIEAREFADDEALLDGMMASCAQPGIMDWWPIRLTAAAAAARGLSPNTAGEVFAGIDPGVVSIVPLPPEQAPDVGAVHVLLSTDLLRTRTVSSRPRSIPAAAIRGYEYAANGIVEGDLCALQRWGTARRRGPSDLERLQHAEIGRRFGAGGEPERAPPQSSSCRVHVWASPTPTGDAWDASNETMIQRLDVQGPAMRDAGPVDIEVAVTRYLGRDREGATPRPR